MNLFDTVVDFLTSKKGNPDLDNVPEGMCPNCWGREEYGGHFYEAIKNHKIDLNNVEEKKGWIQAYAVKHFDGIKLDEKGGQYECVKCNNIYKKVD